MQQFLTGLTAMACWVAALFFFRFWHESKDRLFVMFAIAFVRPLPIQYSSRGSGINSTPAARMVVRCRQGPACRGD